MQACGCRGIRLWARSSQVSHRTAQGRAELLPRPRPEDCSRCHCVTGAGFSRLGGCCLPAERPARGALLTSRRTKAVTEEAGSCASPAHRPSHASVAETGTSTTRRRSARVHPAAGLALRSAMKPRDSRASAESGDTGAPAANHRPAGRARARKRRGRGKGGARPHRRGGHRGRRTPPRGGPADHPGPALGVETRGPQVQRR